MILRYFFVSILLCIISESSLMAQTGISSDGREFYLGFITPSIIRQQLSTGSSNRYGVTALIASLGENEITVSYVGANGIETGERFYRVKANASLQLALDPDRLASGSLLGEVPEYNTVHIVAKAPICVLCYSSGGCAGGSYLALPIPCWGKRYVVLSYNDNPDAIGGLVSHESSRGAFQIIASQDATLVTITPSTTTAAGSVGAISGNGIDGSAHPFLLSMDRGQSVTIFSAGTDASNDITGSMISANKPVAVLGAHENAFPIGGSVGSNSVEGRDYMVEQLIPVECWDTSSSITLPFVSSASPSEGGEGDEIRCVGVDPNSATTITRHSNRSSAVIAPFSGLSVPTYNQSETLTSDQKPFYAMMYDQRMQASGPPYPAPAMMSIIPEARWKSEYSFVVPTIQGSFQSASYIDLVVRGQDWSSGSLRVSYNGGPFGTLQSLGLSVKRIFAITGSTSLLGVILALAPGSYRMVNLNFSREGMVSTPFILYGYGMRAYAPNGSDGENITDDFFTEYASPLGMTYQEFGIPMPITMNSTVEPHCGRRWHVCVNSTGSPLNGIRYIELLNYQWYRTFEGPKASYNLAFDSDADPLQKGEIILDGSQQSYCFDVLATNPSDTAFGSIVAYDNSGQSVMIEIGGTEGPFSIHTGGGLDSLGADQFSFASDTIGGKRIASIVISKDSWFGDDPIIDEIIIPSDATHFHLLGELPKLPDTLSLSKSITIPISFTPTSLDSVIGTFVVRSECQDLEVSLLGRTLAGQLRTSNLTFQPTSVGDEVCSSVNVLNNGDAPLTLYGFLQSDSADFRMNVAPAAIHFPITLKPSVSIKICACFDPKIKGDIRDTVLWISSVPDSIQPKEAKMSILVGSGIKNDAVANTKWEKTELTATSRDHSIIIQFPNELVGVAEFTLYDLLGRVVMRQIINTTDRIVRLRQVLFISGIYIVQVKMGNAVQSCRLHIN